MEVIEFVVWLMLLVITVAGFVIGYFLGKRDGRSPAPVEQASLDDEIEDPTAPIAPVVEIAKSPHDRHRDLEIGNAAVKNLDLLELLIRSGNKQTKADIIKQLDILRKGYQELLEGCSFKAFEFKPGTTIDSSIRSEIKVVEGTASDGPSKVEETLQTGYRYEPDGEEPTVIRKAEVKIG